MSRALLFGSLLLVFGCSRHREPPRTDVTSPAPRASLAAAEASPADAPIVFPPGVARVGERVPFVLFLHGFGSSGAELSASLDLANLAAAHRFAFATPDGARNSRGQRYWNASRACCDFERARAPHVAQLAALIRRASEEPGVDPARVFAIGFSNGGFMAHRLACDVPTLRGVVSVAGAGPSEEDPACRPTHPVRVLQVHGDADDVVGFDGGVVADAVARLLHAPPFGADARARHPSARNTADAWAALDGCRGEPPSAPRVEFPSAAAGIALERVTYERCSAPVELWILHGGDHFAAMGARSQGALVDFLLDERTERR